MSEFGGYTTPVEGARPEPMSVVVRKLVESADHHEEQLEFLIRNVDNSFANGLRRVLLAEIPTLAIEKVDVVANTSVYHDEMLVHRMGLIPFWSEIADEMNLAYACTCGGGGCINCEINCELKVRCHSTSHSKAVYSGDIQVLERADVVRPVTKAGGQGVWLFTLGRGQEVDFRCKIRKGTAKVHARFMATATVAMQYVMDIRLNKLGIAALSPEHRKQWVDKCPTNVYGHDERDGNVWVQNLEACSFCKECFDLDAPFDKLPAPLVSVRPKKSMHGLYDVVFKVETTGALPARILMQRAMKALKSKIDTLNDAVKNSGAPRFGDVPTRPIGQAATAVLVPNQEALGKPREDELDFAMQ